MNKLKNILAFLCISFLLPSNLKAQVFKEGSFFGNAGFGIGSPYFYSGSNATFPPFHVSGEFGIKDRFGVGGLIGYTASRYRESYFNGGSYQWSFNYLIIGARGSYHFDFDIDPKLDLYAGLMLGANIASSKFSSNSNINYNISEPKAGGVAFGFFGGARYMFNENIGAFGELGYNISWLSLGVTFKVQ